MPPGVRQLPFTAQSCDKKQVFNVFYVHRPTHGRYRRPQISASPSSGVHATSSKTELRGGFRALIVGRRTLPHQKFVIHSVDRNVS
jgi:hypothetical protein